MTIERLGQEVEGAVLDRLDGHRDVAVRGDEEDGKRIVLLLQKLLVPAELRVGVLGELSFALRVRRRGREYGGVELVVLARVQESVVHARFVIVEKRGVPMGGSVVIR